MEELILKEREVRENLVELVNNSGLPAFIIREILQDMMSQIIKLEKKQYEEAKQNKEEAKQSEEVGVDANV